MQPLFPSGTDIDCPVNRPRLYSPVAKLLFGCDFHEGKTGCGTRTGGEPEMRFLPCSDYSQQTRRDPASVVTPAFPGHTHLLLDEEQQRSWASH